MNNGRKLRDTPFDPTRLTPKPGTLDPRAVTVALEAKTPQGFGLSGARIDNLNTLPHHAETFKLQGGAARWNFRTGDTIALPVIRRAHPAAIAAHE